MRARPHPPQGSPRRLQCGGAVARPFRRVGAGLVALAFTALGTAAAAQVFEVTDGAIHQVGAAPPPPKPSSVVAPRAMAAAVETAAARYALAPELVDAVARQESAYRADAVSSAGAIGLMQLMPSTARALGVDPWDPAGNLDGGAHYLRILLDRFDGRIDLALAAYNAGPGAVERYAGPPPFHETRAYIAASLDRLAAGSRAAPSPQAQGHQP